MKKRVLIVNAFFDEYRRTGGSRHRVPRAMGQVFLAGAFNRETTELRLYNEQHSGPLRDLELLAWPDMLVLTGLTTSFDRFLHLTAYARSLNPAVIVVAGGPAIRAMPLRSARFFDYACAGDIEALRDVVRDAFGEAYLADDMFPRFDLDVSGGLIRYVESSRYCNFRCSFCSLTGEKNRYRPYDLQYLQRQLEAAGNRHVIFIDNNFYGNDRDFFRERVALLRELFRTHRIKSWSALVTGDFFSRPENLALVGEAGCFSLFSGVESFDLATLRTFNKRHSATLPQVEMIRACLDAGILFTYGIMLDPSTRYLADLQAEIRLILSNSLISLPSFFTLAIPLLGTPYFHECAARNLFLPRLRLHDLDGVVLALKPLDRMDDAVTFARNLPNLCGYRGILARHVAQFALRYKNTLSPLQLFAASATAVLIGTQSFFSSPTRLRFGRVQQTFLATTETLNPLYRPVMRLASRYEGHFAPTMVTEADGSLSIDMMEGVTHAPGAPSNLIVDDGARSAAALEKS